MDGTALYWPMIAQVALIYVVYGVLSKRRVDDVKSGRTKVGLYAFPGEDEPAESRAAARNIVSQFELPVLFFAACLSLAQIGAATLLPTLLAWAFVASRVAHAWVHLTSNYVPTRRKLFIAGYFINLLLWLWLAGALAGHALSRTG